MKKGNVMVIGLTGQSAFLSTRYFPNPGETITCDGLFFEPGGKGHNQAVACARTGAETMFVSAIGRDGNGEVCRRVLEQDGVQTYFVEKEVPTAYAVITTASDGENVVEVYGGAAKALQAEELDRKVIREHILKSDYLLLQNELSGECLEKAIDMAVEVSVPVILNPAPAQNLDIGILSKCWMITPNYKEAAMLAGFDSKEEPSLEELAAFFRKNKIENTVITLGGQGVLLITDSLCEKIPAFSAGTVVDTTGAGDTFNGVLAGVLAMDVPLEQAVRTAVIAAGISVTRRGAVGSIPAKAELQEYIL